jgi:Putative transposase
VLGTNSYGLCPSITTRTHRVVISNSRILDIAEGKVTFRYEAIYHDAQQKKLQADE